MTHPSRLRPSVEPAIVLIAGPTASGKSRIALALAERIGGVVVNADALQVYDGWRALTARPAPPDLARAPHRLFGHVDWRTPDYSVGRWLTEAAAALDAARRDERPAIVVGGTGLYFRALTQGLAEIPPIPAETRAEIDAEIGADGLDAAADRLRDSDPETARRIDLQNPRRVARALEVLATTGRGLAAWREATPPPTAPPERALRLFVSPDRTLLRKRIRARLDAMAVDGALDEARIAIAEDLSPDLPSMKALGAADFIAHLKGAKSLEDAIAAAAAATARYAKRQETWARSHMSDWRRIDPNADGGSADEVARLLTDG